VQKVSSVDTGQRPIDVLGHEPYCHRRCRIDAMPRRATRAR
jgi:hypothetical protein